jgi:pyruvate formate lyase activating enzyme
MQAARFFESSGENKVKCFLCPHQCLIADGKRGICGVRENQNGALVSLVYGKLTAANVDPIEKKPLFHFLPGSSSYSIATMGCNLRCDFCQNYGISQAPRETGTIEGARVSPQMIVASALESGCRSISYTYTEPTIYYEYAFDTAEIATSRGLMNVFVSNGFISEEPLRTIAPYLHAANIDLKSLRDEYYRKICGGRLEPVLQALKLYRELKIWLEITTLIIPGLNDSQQELGEIAAFIRQELGAEVPWHVSAFYPTYKMVDRPPTPRETLVKAKQIGLNSGLKYVYCGNLDIPGGEDTNCPRCGFNLIARSGFQVENNQIKNGVCINCGEKIAGVWK